VRIGVLSKPEHCKSQVSVLKQAGHKVEVLGGDPGISVPGRIDLLVVRVPSISHGAFDVAKAWEREGNPVVYEDGALRILQAIQAIEAIQALKEPPMPTGISLLRRFLDINLWVSSHLTTVSADLLPQFVPNEKAQEIWEQIMLSGHSDSFIRSTTSRLAKKGEFTRHSVTPSWLGLDEGTVKGALWPHAIPSVCIHKSARSDQKEKIKSLFRNYLRSKGRILPISVLPPPEKEPAPPAPPPAPPQIQGLEKLPVLPPLRSQSSESPTHSAHPSPELPEEVRVSLDMLLEAMVAHGFQHVGVDADGSASFIRQVLVEGKVKLGKGSSDD
jgi:hypothetical protein